WERPNFLYRDRSWNATDVYSCSAADAVSGNCGDRLLTAGHNPWHPFSGSITDPSPGGDWFYYDLPGLFPVLRLADDLGAAVRNFPPAAPGTRDRNCHLLSLDGKLPGRL